MTYLKEGTEKISVLHVDTTFILGVRYPLTMFQTGVHVLSKCNFVIQHQPLKVNAVPLQHMQCTPACASVHARARTHTHSGYSMDPKFKVTTGHRISLNTKLWYNINHPIENKMF